MILADTELDGEGGMTMPPCCLESFSTFHAGAPEVVVQPGQEFICPSCGSYTILDGDGEWRFAGGDDDAA